MTAAAGAIAALNLVSAQREAQAYAALNDGSMVGFATTARTALLASGGLSFVTDTEVTAAVGAGRCLVAPLPTGAAVERSC